MLAIALLQLLGFIVLGLLVAPLMFYLIGITVSVIALTKNISAGLLMTQKSLKGFPKVFKKFLWFTDSIMYHSKNSKPEIYPPKYLHSIRVGRENGTYVQAVRNLEAKGYSANGVNSYHLDMSNQATTTKFEKMLNIFHSVILFYKRFYGYSTKVEKNLH